MAEYVYGKNVVKQILQDSSRAKVLYLSFEDIEPTGEFIENVRKFEELSKKYHWCHIGLLISAFSCFIGVLILNVIYLIVPVVWLILSACVLVLAGLFLLFFDVLNDYSSKSLEYKYKADLLNYEKNLFIAKEGGFKGFAFRCERFM